MKKTKEFEAPRLIGVLGAREIPQAMQKALSQKLAKLSSEYICLPFKVEKKYLKNVITCLKLMDIEGLVVLGEHQRALTPFLKLDAQAAKKGRVNIVKRNDNNFVGSYLEEDQNFQQNALKLIIPA